MLTFMPAREASYAMINYIHPPPHLQFDPKIFDWSLGAERSGYTILELGSGSGFVASTIARSLDRSCDYLIATDLPEVWRLPHYEGYMHLAEMPNVERSFHC